MQALLTQKDEEIASLRAHVHIAVNEAVKKRMEEMKAQLVQYEEEVNVSRENRERELQDAVIKWEAELAESHRLREEAYRNEMTAVVEERMRWVAAKEKELEEESLRLNGLKEELEAKVQAMKEGAKSVEFFLLLAPSESY